MSSQNITFGEGFSLMKNIHGLVSGLESKTTQYFKIYFA